MNELYIDYNPQKPIPQVKKRLFTGLGLALIGLGTYLLVREIGKDKESLSIIISAVGNTLLGIVLILQMLQIKFLNPPRFIHVNDEVIEYRFWSFHRQVTISWSSIQRIVKKELTVVFELEHGREVKFKMKYLPIPDVRRIAPHINTIAQKKGIEIVEQGG